MNKPEESFKPDRSRFDKGAASWDTHKERIERSNAIAHAYGELISKTGKGPDLFDYGCGTGQSVLPVAGLCASVTGCDFSPAMLERFSANAKEAGLKNVRTLCLDLAAEAVPAERFDMLTSSMTLHHVADIPAILWKFKQMLVPGGTLAFADLETEDGSFHADNTGVAHFGFDKKLVAEWLASAGFTNVEVKTLYVMNKEVQGAGRDFPVFLATGTRA